MDLKREPEWFFRYSLDEQAMRQRCGITRTKLNLWRKHQEESRGRGETFRRGPMHQMEGQNDSTRVNFSASGFPRIPCGSAYAQRKRRAGFPCRAEPSSGMGKALARQLLQEVQAL